MERGGIDVLMLDFELPEIDCLHILNELASRSDTTPVVIVSSKGQPKLAVKAIRKIHSNAVASRVIVLAAHNEGETAVAAFKLGAQDYTFSRPRDTSLSSSSRSTTWCAAPTWTGSASASPATSPISPVPSRLRSPSAKKPSAPPRPTATI